MHVDGKGMPRWAMPKWWHLLSAQRRWWQCAPKAGAPSRPDRPPQTQWHAIHQLVLDEAVTKQHVMPVTATLHFVPAHGDAARGQQLFQTMAQNKAMADGHLH